MDLLWVLVLASLVRIQNLRPSFRFYFNDKQITSGMENSAEDYFMESDVVLVTINYRLGPLGFMAIPGTNIQVWGTLRN